MSARITLEKLNPYRCSVEELEEAIAFIERLCGSEDSNLLIYLRQAKMAREDNVGIPPFSAGQTVMVKNGCEAGSVEYACWQFDRATLDDQSGGRIISLVLYLPPELSEVGYCGLWGLVLVADRKPHLFLASKFRLVP